MAPRIAPLVMAAVVVVAFVWAGSIFVQATNPEAALARFQATHPAVEADSANLTGSLLLAPLVWDNPCSDPDPGRLEKGAVGIAGWVPVLGDRAAGAAKIVRGGVMMAFGEACIAETLPPLARAVMTHDASTNVPEALAESAAQVCRAFGTREDGLQRVEAGVVQAIGGKTMRHASKSLGTHVRMSDGSEVPFFEAASSLVAREVLVALSPAGNENITAMMETICSLARDLRPSTWDDWMDALHGVPSASTQGSRHDGNRTF